MIVSNSQTIESTADAEGVGALLQHARRDRKAGGGGGGAAGDRRGRRRAAHRHESPAGSVLHGSSAEMISCCGVADFACGKRSAV